MHKFRVCNCKSCGTTTEIGYYNNVYDVIVDIQKGLVRCAGCQKYGLNHTEFEIHERIKEDWGLVWSGKKLASAA